jgi:hypothetical protein
MKAWRFYGFNDLMLDDIAPPACRHGHVVVKVRCVQPSVTEAQLARGIKTFAYDRIKKGSKRKLRCSCLGMNSAHGPN